MSNWYLQIGECGSHDQFKEAGLPLPDGERTEIESLLAASPGEVSTDLLRAIRDAGRWVEQETVAEGLLSGGRPPAGLG